MERIGWVGLGRMGEAMTGRLLEAGASVAVHNRTRAKAASLLERGAHWADSPAAVAAASDIVFTILTDDNAVEQVYSGENGLLAADLGGKLLVEMSTIRTSTILALNEQVLAKGGHMLDAPVSGTLEPARQGKLMALVGGRAEDVERARPALDVLCRRVEHLGPHGAGTTMKLALNMPMAIYWAGLAEAITMGRQFGLDTAQMLDIYLDSPVAIGALRAKAPLLLGEPHEVAFDVTGVRKDLLAMTATGGDAGVPMPTASAALALFAAATAAGYGDRDLVFVVDYITELVKRSFGDR